MKVKVQIVSVTEANPAGETLELAVLERDTLAAANLGLSLDEGKTILKAIQEVLVKEQIAGYLRQQRHCPQCAKNRKSKGARRITLRTLFGSIAVASPRLHSCLCQVETTSTFSPLADLLAEHTLPELLFLETKWAALMSYGLTTALLQDVLPIDESLQAVTVRNHLFKVAERVEQSLEKEQPLFFFDGNPRDWENLPAPDGPLSVGIDGGYLRQRGKGCFEVIAGKSISSFARNDQAADIPSQCFAFVQTYDEKPRRRLFEVLHSQGLQANQQVTFLSDGAENLRDLQRCMSPEAEHILDWFHVSMRLTVLNQMSLGLPEIIVGEDDDRFELRAPMQKHLERLKWFLWHGNLYQAFELFDEATDELELALSEKPGEKLKKFARTFEEFETYIRRNHGCIPNYGERHRQGERISTGFAESTVNQVISKRMSKKQQMQWSQRGAHLLLQIRTRVLNGQWEDQFRNWYPGFRLRVA